MVQPLQGGKVHPKKIFFGKNSFYAPLPREKYAESIGDVFKSVDN